MIDKTMSRLQNSVNFVEGVWVIPCRHRSKDVLVTQLRIRVLILALILVPCFRVVALPYRMTPFQVPFLLVPFRYDPCLNPYPFLVLALVEALPCIQGWDAVALLVQCSCSYSYSEMVLVFPLEAY